MEKSVFSNKILKNKTIKPLIILIVAIFIISLFYIIKQTSSKTENLAKAELFIYPDDDINQVKQKLISMNIISKTNTSFSNFAKNLKYDKNIKPGRYIIKPKEPVVKLVKRLRSGNQEPVKLVIISSRTAEEFAQKTAKNLMISKEDLLNAIEKQGYNHTNELFEYVIPDTYEVYWTVTAGDLLDKLKKYSDKFWENNKQKLKMTNLTKNQVIILASIVSEETNKTDEMPVIAGVYINRLNQDMLLQADPTVKFAVGDFSIRRITLKHLQTDSPFNTYKQKGLPPAPICLPNTASLKAVLKYKKHNYLYFCAKEDFSGYHNFATTHQEHLQNARKYQKALNERNIK